MLPEALSVLDTLAKHLDALEIPYFVGGSVASSMYGNYRSTNDVDIVVSLSANKSESLTAALETDFYVDIDMIREAIRTNGSFNVIHLATMVKADLFLPEPTPFRDSEWSRRRLEQIRPVSEMQAVYIASPEDMILQKLEWFRLTGGRSDHQWGDVKGMIETQAATLEFDYLNKWAADLNLTSLLTKALTEAGLSDR